MTQKASTRMQVIPDFSKMTALISFLGGSVTDIKHQLLKTFNLLLLVIIVVCKCGSV
jgi:hypothetical protein